MSGSGPDDDRDDVLDEALSALREREGSPADAAATRRAILTRAATTQRRRRMLVVRLVLPLAAVLAASTAWAAATGRLPIVVSAIAEVFRSTPPEPSAASTSTTPPPASTPIALADAGAGTTAKVEEVADASPTAAATVVDASVALAPAPVAPAPATSLASTKVASTSSAQPAPTVATSLAADPEEALYRTAHEAHFTQRDWSKALTGWDAYLAAHPKGRFAPEARYNRALTLVRLGRRDEARTALQPFADGAAFGGYRQKEAKALLDAME